MDSEEILDKRMKSAPETDGKADGDPNLAPKVSNVEGVEPANTADDLEQEPEEKENRVQAGSPPTPERVEPGGHVVPIEPEDE